MAGALALVAGLAAPGAEAARRPCAKHSRDPLAPALTAPCPGARIKAGDNFTFRVGDGDPNAAQSPYYPWLDLTRRRARHGVLPNDDTGLGILAQMSPVPDRPGQFRYRAPRYRTPGYWLFRPGVWYAQAQQVDPGGGGSIHYGPVIKITIR